MAAAVKPVLSSYVLSLDKVVKDRYVHKISSIGSIDPYIIPENQFSKDGKSLPAVSYPDIVMYFIHKTSYYTMEQLKAWKSLDAYNQCTSGWVKNVSSKEIKDKVLITAKVLHSQALSKPPLHAWAIVDSDGEILSAHCKCMAGLAESCTHVAALLFWVEIRVRHREVMTPTQESAYWVAPSISKETAYCEIGDIDFTSAQSKRHKTSLSVKHPKQGSTKKTANKPTEEEMSSFWESLSKTKDKPGILSIVNPYSDSYVPTTKAEDMPKILSSFRNTKYLTMNYTDLVEESRKIATELYVTEKEVENVEKHTRDQAKSKLWFRFREGRITASKAKQVCRTNINQPAPSLTKQICYPETIKISTSATRYGCEHEKVALGHYIEHMTRQHDSFSCNPSGLWISKEHPFIAASPDGQVFCKCCGVGCCEVKCPFCQKDKTVLEATSDIFCLEASELDSIKLKKDHAYHFQVQTQLLCGPEFLYCDFVVFTQKEMYIERVEPDQGMQAEIISKSTDVFINGVLPQLLGGKSFKDQETKGDKKHTNSASSQLESVCFCREEATVDGMISCKNPACGIKQFHMKCLGMSRKSKNFLCHTCRVLPEFKKATKNTSNK